MLEEKLLAELGLEKDIGSQPSGKGVGMMVHEQISVGRVRFADSCFLSFTLWYLDVTLLFQCSFIISYIAVRFHW